MDNQFITGAAENFLREWRGSSGSITRTQSAGLGNAEALRATGATIGVALASLEVTPAPRISTGVTGAVPQPPRR